MHIHQLPDRYIRRWCLFSYPPSPRQIPAAGSMPRLWRTSWVLGNWGEAGCDGLEHWRCWRRGEGYIGGFKGRVVWLAKYHTVDYSQYVGNTSSVEKLCCCAVLLSTRTIFFLLVLIRFSSSRRLTCSSWYSFSLPVSSFVLQSLGQWRFVAWGVSVCLWRRPSRALDIRIGCTIEHSKHVTGVVQVGILKRFESMIRNGFRLPCRLLPFRQQ